MISPDDIADMTCLTRDEIEALAEHEHLTETTAALIGDYMMHQHKGAQAVQQMICDDIRTALHADDLAQARTLFATLRHFMSDHPDVARGAED